MSAESTRADSSLSLALAAEIDAICDRFEAEWQAGRRPRVEDYLAGISESVRPELLRQLLRIDLYYRRQGRERLTPEEYAQRFPQDTDLVRRVLAEPEFREASPVSPTGRSASPPATNEEFLELVRKSGLVEETALGPLLAKPWTLPTLARALVRKGLLTNFHVEQLMLGKWRRFNIGKYKVLERLGAGGMGSVWLCEHTLMGRRVALKVLPWGRANDASYQERFYREARAVAALDHPNIVLAYDVGCDEPLHFLVMEYIEGADLSKVVREGGPLPVALACEYVCQAALGLQHAHESAGLVHRDIKPQNLMLTRTSPGGKAVVKITDFGLARFVSDFDDVRFLSETDLGGAITVKANGDWQLTATGTCLGTPAYMAPEQAYDAGRADIRADIFALGCTLFFLLTCRSPYPARTLPEKLAAWRGSPTPVRALRPEVPPGLADVLARALAREPAGRYRTPAELAAALGPFIAGP